MERRLALGGEVQQGPERPQVGGRPDQVAPACSGDMYEGEPTMSPVAVSRESSRMVATPKSVSLARSSRGHQHVGRLHVAVHDAHGVGGLQGGEHVQAHMSSPGVAQGRSSATIWARLGASTSSMTSQIEPSDSTTSCTVTTLGLFRRAAARASRGPACGPVRRPRPAASSTCLTATGRSRPGRRRPGRRWSGPCPGARPASSGRPGAAGRGCRCLPLGVRLRVHARPPPAPRDRPVWRALRPEKPSR